MESAVTFAPPIRVLVSVSKPICREGMARALDGRREFVVVGTVSNADDELFSEVERLRPDVAVIEAWPGGTDELLEAIERYALRGRVVVLSGEGSDDFADLPAESGAVAQVSMEAEANSICDAIAAVAWGDTPLSPVEVTGPGPETTTADRRKRAGLTSRDLEIIELVADGCADVEIACRIYVSESTVKTHLRNTYRKLAVSGRTAAVAAALRQGLID